MRGTAAPLAELQLYTDDSFLKQVTGLEPVTPLRQSGALANYAIPAYKSFPSDSNQQPADYKSAALPLRQISMIGAEGTEPTSTVYKTAALPLDEAPLKTVDPGSGIGEGLVLLISNHQGD